RREVVLHRPRREEQRAGDLRVRVPGGRETQDVELPGRQWFRAFQAFHAGAVPLDGPEEPVGETRLEQRPTFREDRDRRDELLERDVLEEVAPRPGAQGTEDELVVVEGREHEDGESKVTLPELLEDGDPVPAGHAQV